MAGRQNGVEKPTELDLELQSLGDHEVKEKVKADPDGTPPTFGQDVRPPRARSPAGERERVDLQQRIAEHPRPILKKSSQSMAPDMNNRSWQFVEDHSQNDIMLCKICLDVLVAPHLITCCGECVCKKCIDSHQQREAAIREDRKPLCPFCRKTEFRLIENLDLKKSIRKLKVYCLYQESGCMWSGKLQEGEAHLQECAFCPIDCPNGCYEYGKIERRNLPRHLAECPMQIVECSFERIGCKSKDPLPRKEVQVHSSRGIHNHLLLLARSNIKLYEECDITHATLRSSHDETMKEKTAKINAQKQELTSLEQTIESLEANLLDLTQKVNTMKETEDTKRERSSAQLNANNDEARKLQDICQATLTEVQALPIPQATGILCPPVTFTIDNFTLRKNADEEWITVDSGY